MIKLDLTKNKKLSFDLDIEGTDMLPESVELVLQGDSRGNLVVTGSSEGNKVSVDIMSESIKAFNTIFPTKKEIFGKLNVVLEGKIFPVWEGDFQLIKPVEVKLKEDSVSGLTIDDKKKVSATIAIDLDEDVDEILEVKQEPRKKISIKEKFNQI